MYLQTLLVIAIIASTCLSVLIILVLRQRARHVRVVEDAVVWCAQRQERAIVDFVESDDRRWLGRSVLHCTLWCAPGERCSEQCLAAGKQRSGCAGGPETDAAAPRCAAAGDLGDR